MPDRFWEQPFRMLQPNLREIDAVGLDAGALLDTIQDYGGDAILANAGGILAWYPTRLPFQRKNKHLGFDFVGQVIDQAHARGMKVMLRLDVSKQYDDQYQAHPDWFIHDREGHPVREWSMLATCFNGPYWQQHNFEILEELLSIYAPDAIFYNHYRYGDCWCARCRDAFQRAAGLELPDREDWGQPAWRAYIRFRYRAVESYSRRLVDFAHQRRPDVAVSLPIFVTFDEPERLCRSGWSAEGMLTTDLLATEAFNALGRPFPQWIYLGGEESRISRRMGKPLFVGITYSEVFASRRSGQPAAQLAHDIIQVAAHGGNPALAVSGTFEQDDRKGLPAAREAYRFLAANRACYEEMRSLGRTLLVYSQKTMDLYGRGASRERALFEYRGFYEALVHRHFLFDVAHDGALGAVDLTRYSTVLLPNVACLSAEEAGHLDRFVAGGGNLIASFETSLYDQEGRRADEFCLASLSLQVRGQRDLVGCYLLVGKERGLLRSFTETDLLALNGPFLGVEPRDPQAILLQALATTPVVPNNTPEFAYSSEPGADFGLYQMRFGRGTSTYIAWPLGRTYHVQGVPEQAALLADLLDRLNGPRELLTSAPACVEITAAESRAGLVLHLLNTAGHQSKPQTEVIPLHDVAVTLETPRRRARALVSGIPLEVEQVGRHARFVVPRLGLYEVVVLE